MASSSSSAQPAVPKLHAVEQAKNMVMNLSYSPLPTPKGASAAAQPQQSGEGESFDLSTLRKFNKLLPDGKIDEALKLMTDDVVWNAFDGRVIVGRDGCKELFVQQQKIGLRRKPITDWIIQPKKHDDDQDLATFTAQRIIQYEKPEAVPARLVQTITLKRGQITHSTVEAALWQPGLEATELMLRFGSLRAAQKNDQAVLFLDAACEWERMPDTPGVFAPPPELSAPILKGPEDIKKLWDAQEAQGVVRVSMALWEEVDASTLPGADSDAGGRVFSRQIKVVGKGGANPRTISQVARVAGDRIVAMAHREAAEKA